MQIEISGLTQQNYIQKTDNICSEKFSEKMYDLEKYNLEKEIFIKKCIELIRFRKFSHELLNEASKNLGWDRNYYKILFTEDISKIAIEIEKAYDLVIENVKFNQADGESNVGGTNSGTNTGAKIGTTKKIIKLLEVRIINEEIPKSSLVSMNSYYKSIAGIKSKITSSYNTVDKIWKFIDDKSLDFSYYSKRMILFTLYEKAMYFYINKDDSESSDLTRDYIDDIVVKSVAKLSSITKIFKRII
jgi:rpsU-divergently transcribed protein